jgi:predicted nuclease of predicted toxin-antitoxin system
VLFLEDFFTESDAARLRQHYPGVERFATHFRDPKRRVQQSVKDKRIIDFCNQRCWMLVTPDSDMRFTHVEEIKNTEIAILATANNNSPTNEWVDALIQGKVGIERYFRKHPRPSFATFNRSGNITSAVTIGPERYTRRSRPREQEVAS